MPPTDPNARPSTEHVGVPVVVPTDPPTYQGHCVQGDFDAEQTRDTPKAAVHDVAEHIAQHA